GPPTASAVPSTEVNNTSVLRPQAEPLRSYMLVGLGRSPVSVLNQKFAYKVFLMRAVFSEPR
ncbi:MAG: hypothetical protein ABSC21_07070, partial [Terriglobia bacterium]